jgi:hypothetical protein
MMRRVTAGLVGVLGALVVGAAMSGCDLEPDVGPPMFERCDNTDSEPGTPVSWTNDIAPILSRSMGGCIPCHDPAAPDNIGVTVGGLDLGSLASLRRGGARGGAGIVVPGAPCESVLYQKVIPAPPFGGRMPLDGPPFLSATEQRLIHDWIAEGAEEN